ncbi:MAG TPA: tripartite tricarboxylate transporter substrate binding protein [Albitalea sp.]|jgi:tripartite-type tricarboxylate transporter receptor subunit TctC|nr:tripartite tricarboxylate transporter substrate binding protein [Albitalea sp.]
MPRFPNLSRRRIAALAVAALLPFGARADEYPAKPIRMVVPYAPGGTTDVLARIVAEKLQQVLKQPVIVDAKPGANGMLGGDIVAKAPADGYTLLLTVASAQTLNPSLYKMPYDPLKDLAPISQVINATVLMVVNAAVPAKTVQEFVALAKSQPGKINYAHGTSGLQLFVESFKAATGTDIVAIPYKGTAPQLAAVLSGEVAMTMDPFTAIPHIKSGRLRPLAVMSGSRFPSLPDVPSIAEAGYPGVQLNSWLALYAPGATPKPIVRKLHEAIVQIVAMPDVRERLVSLNYVPVGGTPEQLMSLSVEETAKWAKVVKDTGFKVD